MFHKKSTAIRSCTVIEQLDNVLGWLAQRHLAPSTRRVYDVGIRRFVLFCLNYDQPFLPSTAEAIRSFAADLYESGLSLVAARVYISSVRSLHLVNCLSDPVECDQHLAMMLNGWKRNLMGNKCERLPITMCEMRKLKNFIKQSRWCYYDKRMMWSACTIAFSGFLRVSEYTARYSENKMTYLKCGEVVCRKEVMTITLLASKSSQFLPVSVVILSTVYDIVPEPVT